MRSLIVFITITLAVISCRKDPNSPKYLACEGKIDSASTSYFEKESNDFAYKEISNNPNHNGYKQIELYGETVYYYLGRLSSIYRKAEEDTTGSLHDLIFKYKVHNYEPGTLVLNGIMIVFNDSLGLRDEMINQPGNTSSSLVNELQIDHGFNLYPSALGPGWTDFFNTQDGFFNVRLIKEELELFPEIGGVYYDAFLFDGMGIVHQNIGSTDEFVFEYGWGDCPSGCFNHHYWRIQVDEKCETTLVEEFGDDLPE